MSIDDYFPTGIVTGKSFCDREEERSLLKKRYQQNAHVVLMSPRRYGKTSLIAQFTLEQKAPFAAIDLLPATSTSYVENAIVDGVTSLLNAIMPRIKKTKQAILSLFATMNPVIELSAFGQSIKLTPTEKTPQENIMKILLSLDKAAIALNKRLIFVMDEFQQIGHLPESHALEASIRHAVERSQRIFYVFSGSNRAMLEEMFQDDKRALYHLCDELKLGRIKENYYVEFIEKAAKQRWKKQFSKKKINLILSLTETHPYYVNRLCRTIWDQKSLPSYEDIENLWENYVDMQKMDWMADTIGKLSANQRGVLAAIAHQPIAEPQGKAFTIQLKMPSSSIQRIIAFLLKSDFIYKDGRGYYCVLNPAIKTYLKSIKYFDF